MYITYNLDFLRFQFISVYGGKHPILQFLEIIILDLEYGIPVDP